MAAWDLKTAPDSGSASTTTAAAAAVSIHDSMPSAFLLQAHNPMLVRKTCKLVWGWRSSGESPSCKTRRAIPRANQQESDLEAQQRPLWIQRRTCTCSSSQNRRWCCSFEADSVDSTPSVLPPRHHDPAALRVFIFQASWPPNIISRSWTGSQLHCKCIFRLSSSPC